MLAVGDGVPPGAVRLANGGLAFPGQLLQDVARLEAALADAERRAAAAEAGASEAHGALEAERGSAVRLTAERNGARRERDAASDALEAANRYGRACCPCTGPGTCHR